VAIGQGPRVAMKRSRRRENMENRLALTLLRIYSMEIEAVKIPRAVAQRYEIEVWIGLVAEWGIAEG